MLDEFTRNCGNINQHCTSAGRLMSLFVTLLPWVIDIISLFVLVMLNHVFALVCQGKFDTLSTLPDVGRRSWGNHTSCLFARRKNVYFCYCIQLNQWYFHCSLSCQMTQEHESRKFMLYGTSARRYDYKFKYLFFEGDINSHNWMLIFDASHLVSL